MRIHNTWWYLPTFLVAIFFIGCAVVSAMPNENVGLTLRLFTIGTFLLIAVLFFWVSLTVGAYKKHAHELKNKTTSKKQ